ncbi:alpha/beta fold hydrolase [Gilvibacter sediminis]|uniref:alpha/beta fold hydrolase n=1 Tax=Gilvibacter sediminis TaxID=379071 RepID=UPI00234FF38D|nr:alpha/beta fold hydrolase [Gilvibacter sediminis]MDC7998691.1 alpha/beta fold hydrolase [Gilvibacter sediminis]
MSKLKKIQLRHARKTEDAAFDFISYQQFGQPLHTAPVVVVLHALTGNSQVSGPEGWWNGFIGDQKGIDTSKFTVLAFNIPGNGYDDQLIDNPYAYRLKNVAAWVLEALDSLELQEVYALIGGSLGGCLAWQIVALRPDYVKHLIPVAAHWKASPWVVAQGMVQDRILSNSKDPIADARAHAMTFYRNPNAFAVKFKSDEASVAAARVYDWLSYHGKALEHRFALSAYKFMNWLLTTHDITAAGASLEQILKAFTGNLHLVGIQDDLLYAQRDIKQTFWVARELGIPVHHHTLISDQGHDAFLIEQEQLSGLLSSVFASASLKENSYELS